MRRLETCAMGPKIPFVKIPSAGATSEPSVEPRPKIALA